MIWPESNTSPYNLHCILPELDNSNVWIIEFSLNNKALGYCGQFTNPVEHKNGISIQYNGLHEECILKIDKLTKENEGNYSCSVLIPCCDNADLIIKLSSNGTELLAGQKLDEIHITLITVFTVVDVLAIIIIIVCIVRKMKKNCPRKANNKYEEQQNDIEPNDRRGSEIRIRQN